MSCTCYQVEDAWVTSDCQRHSMAPHKVRKHEYAGHEKSDCYYCSFSWDSEVHDMNAGDDKLLYKKLANGAIYVTSEPTVYSTTVETKAAHFDKFANLIGNQFKHGGDKYKLKGFPDREATDVISSIFGGETEFDWVLGTIMKYLFRFKNFQREKDLLKVATYCYILWLKQGNHLKEDHDEDTRK